MKTHPHAAVILSLALLCATTVGCAPAPFVQVDGDTYTISQTSAGGIYQSPGDIKLAVMVRVNEFAESKGKTAVIVSEQLKSALPAVRMPSYTCTFKLVPKPRAASADDFYQQLLQLEDLRSRGIITQGEFETKKATILAQQSQGEN